MMAGTITGIRRVGFTGEGMITGIILTEDIFSALTDLIRSIGTGTGIMEEGDKK
jgi:hypothetical protein